MTECERAEDLVLLLYPDELTAAQRADLEAHAAACASCGRALAELRATARALDGAPIARPSPERWASMKRNVLERVSATATLDARCALAQSDLSAGVDLAASSLVHLEECSSCRDARAGLAATRAALDLVPLVRPSAEKWAALKARVLERVARGDAVECSFDPTAPEEETVVAEAPLELPVVRAAVRAPMGAGVSEPKASSPRAKRFLVRVAAGFLIFALGLAASHALRPVVPAEQLRAMKSSGDAHLRAGDIPLAVIDYERVVREAGDRLEVEPEVSGALAELHALHDYRAASDEPDRERKIIKLEIVVVQHADSLASRYAIQELSKLNAKDVPSPRAPQLPVWDPRNVETKPQLPPGVNDGDLKTLDPNQLGRMWMRTWCNNQLQSRDPLVRASASLQLGRMAEEDGLANEARAHYEDAMQAAPGSPAARRAEERLAKLR